MYSLPKVILAEDGPLSAFMVSIMVIAALVALVAFMLFLKFFKLWLQAKLSCADVTFAELIGMYLRRSDYRTIVLCKITATQGGLKLSTRDLESFSLAGGHVTRVVRALILAKKKNIDLSWEEATTAHLDGRDIISEVQSQGNANEGQEKNVHPLCSGDVGRALSTIKTEGRVKFGETIRDVVSQGEFIDEDSIVEIVEIDGDKITVRPVHY